MGFSADVTDPSGNTVPDSALTWDWNFDDGQPDASTPSPPHEFKSSGNFVVTVSATETADGAGGSATVKVKIDPTSPSGGGNPKGGGGPSPNGPGTGPNGPGPGGGSPGGGSPGGGSPGGGSPGGDTPGGHQPTGGTKPTHHTHHVHHNPNTHTATTPTPSQTPGGRGSSSSPSNATAGTAQQNSSTQPTHTTHTPGGRAPKNPLKSPAAKPTKNQPPLVSGLLVSDVTPLPPGASPLVHEQSGAKSQAPALRRAVTTSALPGIVGALAALMIFSLGAARELRGQRRRRRLLFSN